MRTPLALQAEGDDLALEIVADLLERTDGSHVTSPVCVSSPRPPRPRWRSTGRGRSATHPKGRSAAEDAVDATFLPREEWALAQGKKVASTALRLRRSRRSRSSARSSHHRGHVRRVLNHKSGRRWRASVRLRQEVETVRRRKRNEGRQKAISSAQSQPRANGSSADLCASGRNQRHLIEVGSEEGRDYLSLKRVDPRSARRSSRQVRHADGAGSLLDALRLREPVEDRSRLPCPNRAGGSR